MFDRSRPHGVRRLPANDPTPPTLMFRQGDVLLVAVEAVPEQAQAEPRGGRVVLAEGEVTGHAHAIEERDARTFTHDGQRYLLTKSKAQLIHEEHAPIEVPPGAYRVVIQREYEPEPDPDPVRSVAPTRQWRRVLD